MLLPHRTSARTSWARFVLILLCALGGTEAHAWWNCSWSSRAVLDVPNPGAAQSNAIVEVVLTPAQLPGYNWAGSDADLRVVDASDATLVAHFSEPRPGAVQRLRVWFRLPTLPAGGTRAFLYYGNAAATTTASPAIFTSPGVRLLTRQIAATDPTSLGTFLTQFDAAASPAGYGCTVLPDHVARSNANVFGATTNVHYSMLFFLDVPASQAGNWRVRVGPDFGLGGALYVRGVAVDEEWNDDLWWSLDFANTTELLQTTGAGINLPAGRHFFMVYGSEGCCEGVGTIQLQRPGGPWVDLRTTNFPLVAPSCPLAGVTVARVADSVGLAVSKTTQPLADPFNATTNPKSIPGARVRYSVRVGTGGAGQLVDTNSVFITDPVPPATRLVVTDIAGAGTGPIRFVDGSPASGLTYTFGGLASTTDDVAFSNDGGASFGYVPSPGADGSDPAVTHIRINPKGRPVCTATATPRNFTLEFDVIVR